jgi:hypothetical protein
MPDTVAVHEPFTNCYYFGSVRRSHRYGDSLSQAGYDANAALANIARADAAIVCVKDLAFQAEPYVPDHFLAAATHTLILRHPRIVMRSLLPLKPDFTEDEYGFLALRRMSHRIVATTGQYPLVIDGQELRTEPAEVVKAYCAHTSLAFSDDLLTWSDGHIREWSSDEQESQSKWHHTLELSNGILPPVGEPAFEIPADRRRMYSVALEIYDELRTGRHLCPST